jgi:glycosyltransferase involved in cell wall biosynthesis
MEKPVLPSGDILAPAGGDVPSYRVEFAAPVAHPWCVVIPVINEGERLHRLLDRMSSFRIDGMADIIVMDGGSSDGSVAQDKLRSCSVAALLVKTGAGKLSAQLRCAYAHALRAGYQGIITIDGNDKDDPEAIPRFIKALQSGYDFVQASRFIPGGVAENTPRLREIAIRLLHAPLLSVASGFRWTDTTQGFRAYSRRLLLDPRVAPFRNVFATYELLAYLSYRAPGLGYRCIEVPSARRYPAAGKIPTKISAVRGNLDVLRILVRVCTGRFNPNDRRA